MNESEGPPERDRGVEFGSLANRIDDATYPMDLETTVDRFGAETVDLGDEAVSVDSLLELLTSDGTAVGANKGVRFESPEELRETILSLVGEAAIGQKGYTDRGGNAGNQGPYDSF
ncbi:MAG: DUF5789 family protein [Halobacteriota archaeon]